MGPILRGLRRPGEGVVDAGRRVGRRDETRHDVASVLRPPGDLRPIGSELQVMHHAEEAECFVRDASLICIRPVFDFERQKPMLLATSSRALYRRFTE